MISVTLVLKDTGDVANGGMDTSTAQSFTITVTGSVTTPTISPCGGSFVDSVQVMLACATADAKIRYTTDGTDLTSGSTVYSGPFTLTSSTTVRTVKARAFKSGCNDSGIAAASFSVTATATAATGGFRLASSPAVGSGPGSLTAADLNGDGSLDLAVGCGGGNTVTVLANNGFGVFSQKTTFALTQPGGITATDINGDGIPDLVSVSACNTCNSVLIMRNDGSAQFTTDAILTTQSRPTSVIAVTNLLGDGKVGLAITENNPATSTIEIWTNTVSGQFSFLKSLSNGKRPPVGMASADFNADGKPDLAYINRGDSDLGSISVWTGSGSGSFSLAASPGIGSGGSSVTAPDVNGDGRPDLIAILANSNAACVWTNAGNASFAFHKTIAVGTYPQSVVALPGASGSGWNDFAVLNYSSRTVAVVTNSGNGSFAVERERGI